MPFDYDVIIIGTGFGATVVATELALTQGRNRILMLERGVWWYTPERPLPAYITSKPGDKREPLQYWPRPDHRQGILDLLSVVKTNNDFVEALRDIADRPQPLYRYNSFPQIDILTASGVGGGSLVYSNVSIRPHQDPVTGRFSVMEGWPLELAEADFAAAEDWMKLNRGAPAHVVTKFPLPQKDPANATQQGYANPDQLVQQNPTLLLGRSRWLKEASEKLGPDWQQKKLDAWAPLNLQILEYDGKPADPAKFAYCERQGRCFLGCLPGARHTLNKTFVNPDRNLLNGPNAPVELRALAEVDHIEPLAGGGYKVLYDNLHVGDDDPDRKKSVTAPIVVFAAGVLGTVELLLRSGKFLPFSDQLGRKFSSNGDSAGFVTNSFGLNYGTYATRGPINTSHVMFKDADADGTSIFINVEDAGIPPMLAAAVKRAIEVFSNAADRDPFFQTMKALWQLSLPEEGLGLGLEPDARIPDRAQTEAEMLQNTFFFNVMGRDRARGRFQLQNGKLNLDFEGGPLTNDPVFQKIDELGAAMASAMLGTYVRFPFWGRSGFLSNDFTQDRKVITVHPLGGCPMGETSNDGAVNKQGQLFNPAGGPAAVYPGLFVADAAVVPGPLAVNPTLTIVGFARKIAAQIPAAAAAGAGH
ncbi:MAG TPA: GMC oxidoreductase [Bryobacterales bacterium]|nr:GMC oxidoreductase [Bryobacterales bacterium]